MATRDDFRAPSKPHQIASGAETRVKNGVGENAAAPQ
jgi:hypothetical protein